MANAERSAGDDADLGACSPRRSSAWNRMNNLLGTYI
jgi:hypothetical protein